MDNAVWTADCNNATFPAAEIRLKAKNALAKKGVSQVTVAHVATCPLLTNKQIAD